MRWPWSKKREKHEHYWTANGYTYDPTPRFAEFLNLTLYIPDGTTAIRRLCQGCGATSVRSVLGRVPEDVLLKQAEVAAAGLPPRESLWWATAMAAE